MNYDYSNKFLRPEHIASVGNLALKARLIVEGIIAGIHQSPYHGFSAEFLEFRPYLAGESSKKIDWRKYAKSGRSVVRLYEDETNLSAGIFIDKSSSMLFSSTKVMNKFEYAKTLAAAMAWIFIHQRDAVGVFTFDEKAASAVPPHSTKIHLHEIISFLEKVEASGRTRCGAALSILAASLKKRGLCIILSDLFDNADDIVRGLRFLRFKKQDVIVLRIVDPEEENFDYSSFLNMHDMETGENIMLDPVIAAHLFNEGIKDHNNKLSRVCQDLRIDYYTINTTEPFHKAMLRVLEKRRSMF
jgi:uncharacterized protein (DUF58 family)